MNEPVRARGERRARRALAVVAATLLAGAAPLHAASAKSKVKSRAKIITLSPASSYVLSVEGNFSLTSGEAVESGTVTAPKVQISKVNAGGTSAWFGNGSGRGSLRLDFGNCSLEGPMTFTFLVANPIARVPVPAPGPAASGDDELMSLNTKPTVPPGSVGMSVNAAVADGFKSKKCRPSAEIPEQTVSLGGISLVTALAGASVGLTFPSAGGSVVREETVGDSKYRFTFILKKA